MAVTLELRDRVALVTGGNGGIGLAIADAFAEAGADVAIWGPNPRKNRAALEQLKQHARNALALEVDVTDEEQVEAAFRQVEEELGPVSILVNNAGINPAAMPVLEVDAAAKSRQDHQHLQRRHSFPALRSTIACRRSA